ncbi:MAG: hypothetical protein ABIM30_09975 [candidate division WOR-3 bacterium]
MKKIILIWFIFLIPYIFFGQSLTFSYLRIISQSYAVTPIINGRNGSDGTDNSFSLGYEHFLKNKKLSVVCTYSKFNGCTLIYFEPNGWIGRDGTPIEASGFCHGVKVHRFDVGLSYNLLKHNKKLYFKANTSIGIQMSRKTGVEIWNDAEPVNGPNYFELGPISAEPMNTTQIVPSLGFRTGFVFWKRLDLGLGVQGVYAFRAYQKMYLEYQYKGVVQPMAEYESTGTGLFVTLGIGYRFAKLIK